jgi:hypothetical protein
VPVVLIVAGVLVVGFIVRLALHPVQTILNTIRVILFALAVTTFCVWYFSVDKSKPGSVEGLWFSLIVAGLWVSTFVLPALLRRPVNRR